MKITYIWDALCGWCYGFEAVLIPFAQAHPELEVEVISGGLFDDQILTAQAHPYIPSATERISQIYNVDFTAFNKLISDKGIQANSCHTAAAFALLREAIPQTQHLALTEQMQLALFKEGLSLSEVDTYRPILRHFGLEEGAFVERLTQAFSKKDELHPDFARAQALGVEFYPTLLLKHNGKVYDLKGDAMSTEGLEQNLKQILSL